MIQIDILDIRLYPEFVSKQGNSSQLVEIALQVIHEVYVGAVSSPEQPEVPISATDVGKRTCCKAVGNLAPDRLRQPHKYL